MLFFYPLDFTFVCPTGARPLEKHAFLTRTAFTLLQSACSVRSALACTDCVVPLRSFAEITAFSDRMKEFSALNTEVSCCRRRVVSCVLLRAASPTSARRDSACSSAATAAEP